MSRPWIKELAVGDKVEGFFLVRSKRQQTTRLGKPYLDLDLADASGQINAKVWDNAEELSSLFARGDVIKVRGVVEEYQGNRQLKIQKLRPAREDDEIEMAELLRSTEFNTDEMVDYIREVTATVSDPGLRALLDSFFQDEDFAARFKLAPASRNLHHAFSGGLCEHTIKVLKAALFCAEELYPGRVNRDLVIAGAILHDIGKMEELEPGPSHGYTVEGYLLGHVILGVRMLREKAVKVPELSPQVLLELEHIILSHHGEREWGSPVVPMTPEAMLVHSLDNMDAKTEIVLSAIAEDPHQDEEFTQYHRTLARHFYKSPLMNEDAEE